MRFFCFVLLMTYIPALAQSPVLMLPVGHNRSVNSTSFSQDGKWVATASDDGSIKVWERHSQRLIYTLTGHRAEVDLAVFDESGTRLLSGSSDRTARLWDLRTGRQLMVFTHSARISQVAFSPDGQYLLISAWKEMKAVIRKASDGSNVLECMQETDSSDQRSWAVYYNNGTRRYAAPPDQVGFSRDSRTVWLASYKGIKEWRLEDKKEIAAWSLPDENQQCLAVHPEKKLFAAGNKKDRIRLWNWETRTWKEIFAPGKILNTAAISPDGNQLLTGAEDGSVQLWDAATGRIRYFLQGHRNELRQVRFISDSMYLSEARGEPVQWYGGEGRLYGKAEGTNATVSADGRFIGLTLDTRGSICRILPSPQTVNLETRGRKPMGYYFSKDLSFGGINYEEAGFASVNWATNQLYTVEKERSLPVYIAGISGDEKNYFIRNRDGLYWVNRSTGSKKLLADSITQSVISGDGRYLSYIRNGAGYLLDAHTLTVLKTEKRNRYLASIAFSPRNHWLFQVADSMYVMDSRSGVILGAIRNRNQFNLAPDTKTYFTRSSLTSAIGIYSFPDARPLKLIEAPDIISSAELDPEGKKLVTTSWDGSARVWSYPEGQLLYQLQGGTALFTGARFSPDGKFILTAARDPLIRVWHAHTGKPAYTLTGHSGHIEEAAFSRDGKKIISMANDLAVGIWEAAPDGQGLMIYNIGGELVRVNRQGFYTGAPDAVKVFYFRQGLQTTGIDQLDLQYNRPDLILRETNRMMGLKDTLLITSYRRAREKRLQKLGITANRFEHAYNQPQADFLNRDQIAFEQKEQLLTLHCRGTDSLYTLDRFQVWVNGSPVYGQRGLSISHRNSRILDTSIQVALSQGLNSIECGIRNHYGTESYRVPLEVNYIPLSPATEKISFIGIGIDRFAERGHDLQYSVKDIRDLSALLSKRYGKDIRIDTLFNEQVTTGNVKELKARLQATTVNDKVIIAYSGHGLLSHDFDYYLSTHAVQFEKPEINGLPYEELESLLDSIPARKKLLLIDACHSGEVDKEEMNRISAAKDTLRRQGTKGGKPAYTGKTTMGMQNSFELMQSLFVNVGRSTGATVISAAAGTQFALERGDLKNGVFTYSILEAMNQFQSMKISELKKIVGEKVVQLTNGLQRPTSRNENIVSDWSL